MNPVAKRIIRILSAVIFVAVIGVLLFVTYKAVTDKEAFKSWVDTHMVLGAVMYVVAVTLQIMVALIPGGPIEVAGGCAFGAIGGIIEIHQSLSLS